MDRLSFAIDGRKIGAGEPAYIIAEMSANHNHNFEQAIKIIETAKACGADAIKLQTYTPDTLTIDCDNDYFRIKGTLWEGKTLYKLYGEAYTPWEWQAKLKEVADRIGIQCFSSPFDFSAVDFLEKLKVPAYKIASFEIVDIPLIEKVAQTGKPIIISTGMANLAEITDAVTAVRRHSTAGLALLKCTSSYPAPASDANLATIPHLSKAFGVPTGLSDHTMGVAVPVAAVALGACIIEKHFTLSRGDVGPDSAFSLEPKEFKEMVDAVRIAEQAIGNVKYEIAEAEKKSIIFRRSLFVVKDVAKGELLTSENVRSIRPGHGLPPKFISDVIGRKASGNISRGTPLHWSLLQ